MDVGDIIYYIILVFFLIFGFFSKSNKQKKTQESRNPPSFPRRSHIPETPASKVSAKQSIHTPPPVKKRGFQSSLDLVTDFEGESSLKNSMFSQNKDMEEQSLTPHPLMSEIGNIGAGELRKGIIYSEILKRKF